MAKQAITLKIAGKSYPFNIESGKEEIYRLAEREVNSYLALIKQQHIKNWNDQDYLAMAALKFAIANVGMRQSREIDSEDMKQLEKIGTEKVDVIGIDIDFIIGIGRQCFDKSTQMACDRAKIEPSGKENVHIGLVPEQFFDVAV